MYLLSFLCRTAVIFIVRIDAAVSVSIIFRSDLLIPLNIYNKDRRTADIDRHRHCCAVDHGGTGYIRHIDRDLLVMAALLFNNIDRFINPRFFDDTISGKVANVQLVDTDGDVIATTPPEREFVKPTSKGLYVAFKYNIKEMETEVEINASI